MFLRTQTPKSLRASHAFFMHQIVASLNTLISSYMLKQKKKRDEKNKGGNYICFHQKATFPLPLYLDPMELKEFMGLTNVAGVIIPSFEPMVELIEPIEEDIVPVREEATELPFVAI